MVESPGLKCCISENQTSLTQHVKPVSCKSDNKSSITKSTKDTIKHASVNFVCEDLRPFDTLGGKGFVSFVQEVSVKIITFNFNHC